MSEGKGLHPDVQREQGESNWEWCQRYAANIEPEAIIRALAIELARIKRVEAWSAVGYATSHGSGVSQATCKRLGLDY